MLDIHTGATAGSRIRLLADLRRGITAGAVVVAVVMPSGTLHESRRMGVLGYAAPSSPMVGAHFADFGTESASYDARHLADWIADSRDNADQAFVILDKKFARLYVFDKAAKLRAVSSVLLGAARGDDTVPGIGSRPIAEVRPEERTTPAGRFVAERGHDAHGQDVVWVDYDAAVAMHRVVTTNLQEHRLERLASPTVADKRISYGCINLPADFYDVQIRPIFAASRAIVYVLPESKPVEQVFKSYDARAAHRVGPVRLGKTTA